MKLSVHEFTTLQDIAFKQGMNSIQRAYEEEINELKAQLEQHLTAEIKENWNETKKS